MVDTLDCDSSERNLVQVQVLLSTLIKDTNSNYYIKQANSHSEGSNPPTVFIYGVVKWLKTGVI
jgi:hypothetical protein